MVICSRKEEQRGGLHQGKDSSCGVVMKTSLNELKWLKQKKKTPRSGSGSQWKASHTIAEVRGRKASIRHTALKLNELHYTKIVWGSRGRSCRLYINSPINI
mmetsp:Transcript_919/g.2137  ORF Transcript_919/g.2137 Transcript_919/m.2137 type:complete len:102 (-) Transcript_919:2122-2427(-)